MAVISITKSPPWETFAKELNALFVEDPCVDVGPVTPDNDDKEIRIFVSGHDKYQALSALIPTKKTFGNVTLYIRIHETMPPKRDTETLFKDAFSGNSSVSDFRGKTTPGGNFTYIAFKPNVVQFFDDNIADLNGKKSMLMEDIARDVFTEQPGFFFCTDVPMCEKKVEEYPF